MENFQAEELQSDLQDIINEYAGKDQMLGAVSEVVGKYQELTTDTLSGTSQKQNVRVPISYLEEEE
ncbi:hypothetical protein J5893_03495 [bacterium]|nr:hypothetical protein [bacterium]